MLKKILSGVMAANEAWKVGSSLLTRTLKVTGDHFRNIDMLLNLTRRSLQEQYEELTSLDSRVEGLKAIVGNIINEIHVVIRQLNEIEQLFISVQQLSQGHFPHHLVSESAVNDSIDHLQRLMTNYHPHFQLLNPTPQFVYRYGKVTSWIRPQSGVTVMFCL